MVGIEEMRKPSSGIAWIVCGAILLVVGLIGIAMFVFTGTNTPVEGNAPADAAWQSASIVGGAVCTGVGLVTLVVGILKRRRYGAHGSEQR